MIKEGGALLKRVCGSATRHRKFQSMDEAYNATISDRSVHELAVDEDDADAAEAADDTLQSDLIGLPESTEVEFFYDLMEINFCGYHKMMNSMIGNTHTGSIRMNAVEPSSDNPSIWAMSGIMDPDDPPIEVVLRNPTVSNIVGGQVYIPSERVTEMATTRKNRDKVSELLPGIIFLCRHGMEHVRQEQAAAKISDVIEHVDALQEVYDNWVVRNNHEENLATCRVELFCLYNVDGQRMTVFPEVVPSSCVHFFSRPEMHDFMLGMMEEHVRPVLELLKRMRPQQQARASVVNFDLTQLSPALRTRIVVSTDIALTMMGSRDAGAFSKNLFRNMDAGASLEIPNEARMVLSAQEIEMYHFKYGVIPGMIPLANVNAPKSIGDLSVNLSARNCFPPYLPVLGQAMLASSSGTHFASNLEQYKGLVRVCILRFGFEPPESTEGEEEENDTDIAEGEEEENVPGTRFGLMDEPNYVVLAKLSVELRGQMMTYIARLLLGCGCHDTWMWVVNGRQTSNNTIFPLPAGEVAEYVAEQFDAQGRLKFEHFPFTTAAIQALKFPHKLNLKSEIISART